MYPTITIEDYKYIFEDASVKLVFVSDEALLKKVKEATADLKGIEGIFTFDEIKQAAHWSTIVKLSEGVAVETLEERKQQVSREDLLTLIYTSNKSAQDTKNSSYESRLTAVESKATTYATITDMNTKADKGNYATVEYIDGIVTNLVNSAPETLDTLNELANALGNDPNFATTVSTQIGQKANKTDVDSQIQKVTTELVAHNSDEHAHTAILNAHNADVNAHSVAFGTVLKKSDITVITGEVANGGTIPLPDGFLESECKWFAGIKHSNVNEWRIDVEEGSRSNLLAPICTLNGRVVTVGTQVAGLDGGSYTENGPLNFGNAWARAFIPGTAWYMCIGIHR